MKRSEHEYVCIQEGPEWPILDQFRVDSATDSGFDFVTKIGSEPGLTLDSEAINSQMIKKAPVRGVATYLRYPEIRMSVL